MSSPSWNTPRSTVTSSPGSADADGRLLWSAGGRSLRDRTEQVNFAPGAHWDETSVGTNAIGLSLVLGRPVEVFADEHWCEAVKDWVCYSAPVRNAGGAVVGSARPVDHVGPCQCGRA